MKVSVVIPTFNRAAVLARSVRSVQLQTLGPSEIIVVDDGSSDGTQELVAELASEDSRIRYVHQPNGGAPSARNHGARLATGDLISFQDSDDEWEPQFLELVSPQTDTRVVAFSSHRIHHRDGTSADVPKHAVRDVPRALRRTNIISTQTAVMPRSLALQYPFDESLRRFQDWDLWLTMLGGGVAFVHVPIPLVTLHREADSISEGSPRVRSDSLKMIAKKHRDLLSDDLYAKGRLFIRAYARGRGTGDRRARARGAGT